jgi:Tfp pilus assembly protein PilO
MNLPLDRDFLLHAVIALGICIGGWMMVVQPKARELARLEQSLADNAANPGSIKQQTIEQAAQQMASIRQRVSEVDWSNRLAGDSSRLYGLVMDLADAHGVQVQNLQPGMASKKAAADAAVSILRLDMTVEGPYESVARFIEAVMQLDTSIRPTSLQLAPTKVNGRPVVTAALGCDVLTFTLSDALAGFTGNDHAQP